MAKLPQSTGGSGLQIKELAPAGQHIGVCVRITDLFQVERPTFENPQVKELTDVTRFVFGIKDATGKLHLVQTYEFSISGAPGANLMKFLKAWLGADAAVGWDYCEMLGKGIMLTVQHKAGKKPGTTYANISGCAPVHPQLAAHVPNAKEFEAMIIALERNAGTPATSAPPVPPGPATTYPAAPVTPPPPPPTPAAKKLFAVINGAVTETTLDALRALPATTQAIYEGESAWSTAVTIIARSGGAVPPPPVAPPAPPTFPPAATPVDEDVPF